MFYGALITKGLTMKHMLSVIILNVVMLNFAAPLKKVAIPFKLDRIFVMHVGLCKCLKPGVWHSLKCLTIILSSFKGLGCFNHKKTYDEKHAVCHYSKCGDAEFFSTIKESCNPL
jgi:hypothetical protein